MIKEKPHIYIYIYIYSYRGCYIFLIFKFVLSIRYMSYLYSKLKAFLKTEKVSPKKLKDVIYLYIV